MGLRDVESTLPPGFRFHPSDEELVCHYLHKKVTNEKVCSGTTMVEVDLHTREPWELPDGARLNANEWYFFSFRDRKYSTGSRTNRATKSGYWKATGKDRTVYESSTQEVVGMRKTLVFYRGRAPNGTKTGWVMHEFRLENPHTPPKEDWVLCRVFLKIKGEMVSYGADNEQDNVGFSSFNMQISSTLPQIHRGTTDGHEQQLVPSAPQAPRHHQEGAAGQNDFLNLAMWHCSFLDFPQGTDCPPVDDSSKEYGFLLNVEELVDNDMGDVGMSSLEEMKFHIGEDKISF